MPTSALAALGAPRARRSRTPRLSPPVGAREGSSALHARRADREGERDDDADRADRRRAGFGIDSFVPSPGWKRKRRSRPGAGENAVIQKVTWTGGSVPTGEDSLFSFLAQPSAAKTYTFGVRQTYSDGSVVDWTGPESSDDARADDRGSSPRSAAAAAPRSRSSRSSSARRRRCSASSRSSAAAAEGATLA